MPAPGGQRPHLLGGKPASVWPGTQPSSSHRGPIVHTPQIPLEGEERKQCPQRPRLWAASCGRRGTGPPAGPGVERHRSRFTVPSEGIAAAPLLGPLVPRRPWEARPCWLRGQPPSIHEGARAQASGAPAGPLKAVGASLLAPPWTGRGKQRCHSAGHAGTCESCFHPEEKGPSPGAAGQVAAGSRWEKEFVSVQMPSQEVPEACRKGSLHVPTCPRVRSGQGRCGGRLVAWGQPRESSWPSARLQPLS